MKKKEKGKNQLFYGITVILLIFISACTSQINSTNKNSPNIKLTGETKEFRIEAFRYGFEPNSIEVNKGDKVKIIATSRDVPHGLTIPEFGVSLYMDGLKEDTAEFIADKTGKFNFYCNVPCGSGHGQMKGILRVN